MKAKHPSFTGRGGRTLRVANVSPKESKYKTQSFTLTGDAILELGHRLVQAAASGSPAVKVNVFRDTKQISVVAVSKEA